MGGTKNLFNHREKKNMSMKNTSNTFITLILVVLLIPFLSIAGIKNNIDVTIYQAWQITAVISLMVFIYLLADEIKINWAVVLFTLYQAVIILSSYLKHGFSLGIVTVTAASTLLFMLMQTPCYREVISAICIIVVAAMIINLPIMISNLSEEYAVYFIGGKNSLSMFLIPGAFLYLISSLETEGRLSLKCVTVMGLCLLSIIIGDSGTGIVVVFFVVVLMILMKKIKISKWIYIFAILLLYALLILFSTVFLSTDFWIFVTGILGKDSTLTSRVAIWNIAKDIIGDNWLLGSGRGTEIAYINQWEEHKLIDEAHNFILEVLMEGGVVAFTIFSALFYNIVDKLDMNNIRNKMVFITLCALLINGLTESTVNNLFVTLVLGLACHYAMENRGKKISNE